MLPIIKIGAGLGCLLALVLLAGQGWWDWQRLQAPVPGAAATRAARGEEHAAGTLAELVALDLFGAAPAEAAVLAPQDLPQTPLDLGLRGVFASDSDRLVGAVIALGRDGRAELFRVGDEIAPGVVLRVVAPGGVVIQRAGALETLRFPLPKAGADASRRQPAVAPSADANAARAARPRGG